MNASLSWKTKKRSSTTLWSKGGLKPESNQFKFTLILILFFSNNEENDKFKGALEQAIVTENPNVSWDDISGLEGAKKAL